MPLHERDTVREQMEDCVFAGRDLTRPVPKYRFPRDETQAREAFQVVADELMLDGNARQNLATFCQTWAEPEAAGPDGAVGQQEHDRQGRVPADRRDRGPLRAHAGRPVACARGGQHRGRLGHRLLGGLHAGGHGGQMAVAGQAAGRRQADGQAEHGVRPGPGGVAQVRPLLGHRDARGPDVPWPLRHGSGLDAGTGGREHDHGRADAGRHLYRRLRAGGRPCPAPSTSCRPTPAWTSTFTWTGPAAPSSPRSAPPTWSSTSGCPGSSRSAPRGTSSGWLRWASAGSSGGTARNSPRTWSSTSTTWAATCRSSRSTSPARPGRSSRSTTTSCASASRGTSASTTRPTRSASTWPPRSSSWARSSCSATATRPPASRRSPGGSAKARTPATRCSTWPTGCAPAGWQVPAYTLTGTASDIAVQRILVRLGVSQDMASLLLDDFRNAVAHFAKHPVTVPMSKEETGGFNHL